MSLVLAGLVALLLVHLVVASFGGSGPFLVVLLGAVLVGRHLRRKAQA